MCIQLLGFAIFRRCCQQAHRTWSYFRYRQSRTDWALEFCNFCIEFCKKPSRITFLMQGFAGLCTGKVKLSFWMLQNTSLFQALGSWERKKVLPRLFLARFHLSPTTESLEQTSKIPDKTSRKSIDQRTNVISAVQSSWQTTRVTLIHTILTKIQSSFFQFL